MASLDTNVLVRYFTQDDPVQYPLAKRFIDNSVTTFGVISVPITVILETEWVLRSRYKFDKTKIIDVFNHLLDTATLEIDESDALMYGLLLYQNAKADFADCLHTAIAFKKDKTPFYSFDVNAGEIDSNTLLTETIFKEF